MIANLIESSSVLKGIFGLFFVVAYFVKFLVNSHYGWLLSSIGFYLAAPLLMNVQPWTFGQLILWFDGISVEAKVGVASSLVTVLGFFVALQTTMHSWHKQTAVLMRMTAAESIDRVISEANSIIIRIGVFSENLEKEVLKMRAQQNFPQEKSILPLMANDISEFEVNRKRLLQLEQEIIAFSSRYVNFFVSTLDVPDALEKIPEQVRRVMEVIWINIPIGDKDDIFYWEVLVRNVDVDKLGELSRRCYVAHEEISVLNAAARGIIFAPIVEMNWLTVLRTLRHFFRGEG